MGTVADSGVRVRPATAKDLPAILALDARAWPPGTSVVPPGQWTPPEAADLLVGEVAGVLVGYAQLGRHHDRPPNAHVLHLRGIAVAPEHVGAGYGGLLLDAAVAEARRRGARKLGLRVLGSNPRAQALYRGRGFVQEARLIDEFFLDGRYVDDLWMALSML